MSKYFGHSEKEKLPLNRKKPSAEPGSGRGWPSPVRGERKKTRQDESVKDLVKHRKMKLNFSKLAIHGDSTPSNAAC